VTAHWHVVMSQPRTRVEAVSDNPGVVRRLVDSHLAAICHCDGNGRLCWHQRWRRDLADTWTVSQREYRNPAPPAGHRFPEASLTIRKCPEGVIHVEAA